MHYLNSRNQVQYVDKHSSHPPMPDGPLSPGRDLHRAARLMLLCQEIERACSLDGTQPGTAPEGRPCGALWVKSIVWPHWSLTGHIVALWDITHTKETGRIVSHSKWRSPLESKKIWAWGCQRSVWGCVCVSGLAILLRTQLLKNVSRSFFFFWMSS